MIGSQSNNIWTDIDTDSIKSMLSRGEVEVFHSGKSIAYSPGADADVDIITINVSGTPTFRWDEETNCFEINKSLTIKNSLGIGKNSFIPARTLHIQDDNGVIRIDRDANSPGFILARFPSNNYTTPWKSFIVGVAAEGPDDGTFHITDIHTNVAGGGDRRLTIENDGTIGVPGNLVANKFYLGESGTAYIGWQSGDGVFQFSGGLDVGNTLFANDINGSSWVGATIDATDYVLTPIIQNIDGDTVTILDNLDVTGLISSTVGLDAPEVSNTLGTLKLQPDAQGNVELFGDTAVGNEDDGKMFYVHRQAAEGNDYIRMYMSSGRTGYIHSNRNLTLQGQINFTINSVTNDIIFKVGDSVGAKKVYFKNNVGATVASIDSRGDMLCNEIETTNGVNAGGDITVGGTVDGVDVSVLNSNVIALAESLDTLTTLVGTNTIHSGLHSGNPHSVTVAELSLQNVDNTSDVDKPISIATQTALNLKAPLASPSFTGNVLIGTGTAHDNFHIIDTAPSFIMEESDALNSEKVWEWMAVNGKLSLKTQSDLYTASQTVMEVDRGGTSPTTFCIPNSKVGIGTTSLSGKLTVNQASVSGAIPVLTLDQADVSEPWIEFLGGAISGGMSGTNKYIKVKVGNDIYYLRLFN